MEHLDKTCQCDTEVLEWCESRLQSTAAVRHQTKEIRGALLKARQTVNDPAAKVEAQALA